MRTILINLPCSVKGFITIVEDEEIIVLNSRLTWESNCQTYKHELEHITHNDLYNDLQVDLIELVRHEK